MLNRDKSSFPRPNFIRENYVDLNGNWYFDFDDDGEYISQFIKRNNIEPKKNILVPFPYQSPESNVNCTDVHEHIVYNRKFELSSNQANKTVLLHFGAVDHTAKVFVNGTYVGEHRGGYTHFQFDITPLIQLGENDLTVFVEDLDSPSQCRGKQIWHAEPSGCHYVAVSGIWQDVWLEFTESRYITDICFRPDFNGLSETAEIYFNQPVCGSITAQFECNGSSFGEIKQTVNGNSTKLTIHFEDYGLRDKEKITWSPSRPNLFDVRFSLESSDGTDDVESYFGFRSFEAKGDRFYLNNSQYYLKMVLDQGYWVEGIYRPKDNDSYRIDVEKTKELGFNGARKHQKVEDPRYYYWADRLGLIVWGELPSFYCFNENAVEDATVTLKEFIQQARNYPSIVTWVVFNESWGLRRLIGNTTQSDFAKSLYYLCKTLDSTRLVSTNDGWENMNPTDIITVHDYRNFTDELIEYYRDIAFLNNGSGRTGHPFMIPGEEYKGQPIMLTEFGGKRSAFSSGWGYDDAELDGKEFRDVVNDDIGKAEKLKLFSGYCYTQLTDVYQETNGILDMNRNEH